MSTASAKAVCHSNRDVLDNRPGQSPPSTVQKLSELLGRIFLAAIFLIMGLDKLGAYVGTAAYMASVGVPGALLPAVIALEVFGAIAIIVGWKIRITALLLAGFSLLAAVLFHRNFADQTEMIMFLKNVAIAGGFLQLAANGGGPWSLDHRRAKEHDQGFPSVLTPITECSCISSSAAGAADRCDGRRVLRGFRGSIGWEVTPRIAYISLQTSTHLAPAS